MFEDALLYPPKTDSYRFPFYDLSASSDCYSEHMLRQRDVIIKARAQAGFSGLLEKSPYSWFSANEEALENVNQGSYLFNPRFKPKMEIQKENFLSKKSAEAIANQEISKLEKQISNYLHTYNKYTEQSRLNHPLNFFYLDLKNILTHLSKTSDPAFATEQIPKILNYIRDVEKCFGDDEKLERAAMADIRSILDEKIMPYIEREIESESSRGTLVALSKYLLSTIENTQSILHHLYTSNEISAYTVLQLTENYPEALNLEKYPLHAIKDCAESNNKKTLVTTENQESLTSATAQSIAHLNLDECQPIKLVDGVSLSDKALYLKAISELYSLTEYLQSIPRIIDSLDVAGEISTTLLFSTELKNYLAELNRKLESSRELLQQAIKNNQRLYREMLREGTDDSITSQLWRGLFSDEGAKRQFIKNQDMLSAIQYTEEQTKAQYKRIKDSINSVLSKIDSLSQKFASSELSKEALLSINAFNEKIAHLLPHPLSALETKHSSLQLASPDETPNNQKASTTIHHHSSVKNIVSHWCLHGSGEFDEPTTLCVGETYHAFVFPKTSNHPELPPPNYASISTQQDPILGDAYKTETCRPLEFYNHNAIYCEGENSHFVYVPKVEQSIDAFVSQGLTQVALGAVFFKMFEWGYEWLTNGPTIVKEATSSEINNFFLNAYKELALANCNSSDNEDEDMSLLCDDLYDQVNQLSQQHKKGQALPIKELNELQERILYFRKSTTKLNLKTVMTEQAHAKEQLCSLSGLSSNDFALIKKIGSSLSSWQSALQDERLLDLATTFHYKPSSLLAFYELWQQIESLVENPAPVFESDLIDLETEFVKMRGALAKGELLQPSQNLYRPPKVFSFTNNKTPLFWQPPGTTETKAVEPLEARLKLA